MRDIKFRAWNSIDKCMCDNSTSLTNLRGFIKSKHYQPMQYTGLKDCNGVEVYEGDIVSVQYDVEDKTIHTVEWGGKSYPAFELMPQLDCECNGFAHYYEDPDASLEVIGNIHENPELLSENK